MSKHKTAPDFELLTVDGELVSLWDYRQRKNLVLLFLKQAPHAETQKLITQFSEHYTAFREESGEVLLITDHEPDTQEKLPFPILLDPQTEVIDAYVNSSPENRIGLFILDRYGEVWQQWQASTLSDLPEPTAILDTLAHIEMQCPE